ncbi:MAG: carboxypeptidase-like regulatory domain-containing protein [Flavobacteriaceae bacterium]
MPKNSFLLLFTLFICASSSAQTSFSKSLNGRVLNADRGIPDVHVMNTSANRATISDENGYFSIQVNLNDTLIFSAVQFKRKTLIITSNILQSLSIQVPLEEFVNELDEVILRPYDLSGDLSRDMGQMNTGRVVAASTVGLPNAYVKPITQAERKLHEATTGGSGIPLNPIINAITGRTKYLKKVLATENKYARTDRVRAFYADSLFVQELKIPTAKIDDFMYYCEIDLGFSAVVDTHDRLKIWEYLKQRSAVYRENNELD